MMGYQASSLVLLKVAYSFFYAYSLLAIVLGLLQAMVGSSIISPRITKSIVVTFWILAILQFFGSSRISLMCLTRQHSNRLGQHDRMEALYGSLLGPAHRCCC